MQIQLLKFIQYLSAGALVLITFNTSIKVLGAEWMIEQFAGGNRNQVVNLVSMFIFGFLFGVSKVAQSWSHNFGPLIKVDRNREGAIRNDQKKPI